MPINTFWFDEEQTIICQELLAPLIMEDFKEAFQRTKSLNSNFVIVDATAINDLPRGLLAIQAPLTQQIYTENRVVVTATTSDKVRVIATSFFKVAGYATIEFVETLEEAESLIRQFQTG